MNYLLNECFKDFDQLADQARAWQLEFVQLDRGPGQFELLQADIGGVQITRASFSRRLQQRTYAALQLQGTLRDRPEGLSAGMATRKA